MANTTINWPVIAFLAAISLVVGVIVSPIVNGDTSVRDFVLNTSDYPSAILAAFRDPGWPLRAAPGALVSFSVFIGLSSRILIRESREVENSPLGKQRAITSKRLIRKMNDVWDGINLPERSGICVGSLDGKSVFAEAVHSVHVAPSQSGKSRGSVFQSIDYNTFSRKQNIVVTDPSLELFVQSRRALEDRGYKVYLIDLESGWGNTLNPIAPISVLCRAGETSKAQERARELASILSPKNGDQNDWVAAGAAGVIAGVAYAIASSEGIPDDARNLWTCYLAILEGSKSGTCAPLKSWLESFGMESPAAFLSASFRAAADKQEASILSAVDDAFAPFATDTMRSIVSGSEFDISHFPDERVAVFIRTLPASDDRNKLASVILAQLWSEYARRGIYRNSLRPCQVLADEAHVLPRFDLVTAFEQGRKCGFHLHLWLQSFSGLDKYKTAQEDGKDAILANASLKTLFRAGSRSDAEYFSAMSGEKVVLARSVGEGKSSSGTSSNDSLAERNVPVWSVGDILDRDPSNHGILVIKNVVGHPERSGRFEIPVADVTKTPTARNFAPAFGSPDYEAEFIAGELDQLADGSAIQNRTIASWKPDFDRFEESEADDLADMFGV